MIECEARQYSDQMHCKRCNLTWDMNDLDPPSCLHSEESEEIKKARKNGWISDRQPTPGVYEHTPSDESGMGCGSGVEPQEIRVGMNVKKVSGYSFPGVVVSVFRTTTGRERFVIEATGESYKGMLHIFNRDQLAPAP